MTNISEQIAELRELIEKSEKILITSHISPDPDSICSILLLGTTLRENYPDKIIVTSSEELLGDLDFLAGYDRIQQMPLIEVVAGADLVIMVDAMNFERASRKDALGVRKFIQQKSVPFIIIDHHEPNGVDDNQVYINESYPSCVQQVYKTLFEDLKLTKPDGYANTTMVGLYSDTGGFTYIQRKPKETLKLIGELIDQGVDVQQVRTQLSRYSMDQIRVLKELLNNISSEDDYTYSYLSNKICVIKIMFCG